MTTLLLGGTGFVGRNIAKEFESADVEFVTVSRSSGYDITEEGVLLDLLNSKTPDFVINCAADVGSLNYVTRNAAQVIDSNMSLISSLYEAIRKCGAKTIVLNPIANCAYPGKAELYTESEWLDGAVHPSVAAYGETRRMLYAYSVAYEREFGIKSYNFLAPNMYGPFDSTDPDKAHALNALVSKFVKAQFEGVGHIEIWGTGMPVREWLYARDFARILLKFMKNDKGLLDGLTGPLNIGQNNGHSMSGLAGLIQECFNSSFEIRYLADMADGAPKKVMDDTMFRRFFPDFEFTPIKRGIKETIDYYNERLPF